MVGRHGGVLPPSGGDVDKQWVTLVTTPEQGATERMPSYDWKPAFGANIDEDGVTFAVWAPDARRVEVELVANDSVRVVDLDPSGDGRYSAHVAGLGPGALYRFRVDGNGPFPDPYSRYQPVDVHGPSEVIDPSAYEWRDREWDGLRAEGLVIYEAHVGTMTRAGTFNEFIDELDALKDLGVSAIELMPVAQCPGLRNWGYDGVDLFAPSNAYGRPDDLRRLVDEAHQRGLGVIMDVVYNHLGPEGNYLRAFATSYFSDRHSTPWGDGLNWDGADSRWVRQFAIDNACSWIAEFHIDGLRLDATHALIDDSPVHIVQELTQRAREVASGRSIVVFAEDGRHEITRARSLDAGGEGLDGIWADDFHHEVRVLLTNARENYYSAYEGTTLRIAEAINLGLEQDFTSADHPVGNPITEDDPASAFVFCIQNHDQVGNRPFGERLHHEVSLDRYLTASALLLCAPETPLLFMGQEFAASTPFLYFTDHPQELGRLVTHGRRDEFAGFRMFHDERLRDTIPDPQAETTFLASKLDVTERETNAGVLELYRTLLGLRRNDPVLSINDRRQTEAVALTAQVVALHRWVGQDHRILIANFGAAIDLDQTAMSALSPPASDGWTLMLDTSGMTRGGSGIGPAHESTERGFTLHVPARAAAIWSFTSS
ncbi:MAG: GH13_10 / GH13 / GH13_9 / GH13_36 / GH13_ 37 / GH13_11 / GH13_8 / GH13_1 [uncultured Thermomicrobiales bacterium]|uniref:Malto-oligosyltrehalose trehalohydrolase n=1 Tax=uncultured Thermomicrobiales bacterium TaxID=1645740 RepID=A0A6J4UUQ4_9BACT|nr:MAG: GH13_10 / GH13 / GH13_9 / GH13_36 / GH13_ 37 / GH13_11 / GH13_8 / GH13_1 [uncultured Thermomicrobiales bacterium]